MGTKSAKRTISKQIDGVKSRIKDIIASQLAMDPGFGRRFEDIQVDKPTLDSMIKPSFRKVLTKDGRALELDFNCGTATYYAPMMYERLDHAVESYGNKHLSKAFKNLEMILNANDIAPELVHKTITGRAEIGSEIEDLFSVSYSHSTAY